MTNVAMVKYFACKLLAYNDKMMIMIYFLCHKTLKTNNLNLTTTFNIFEYSYNH